jgi:capsular polysaccharide biosynthesis protein
MSEQTLDLRRSMQLVWRHKVILLISIALGILAGAGYTVRYPPMLSSQALVVLSPTLKDARSQVFIASSDRVLNSALQRANPHVPLATLRNRLQVQSESSNVISITAQGKTAAQAESTANAVAESYVDLLTSGQLPGRVVPAQILSLATDTTTATPLPIRILVTALLGALLGALIGAFAALVIGRSDRHLRERDEIAESIGAPVLASIPAARPSDSAGWKKLFEEYEPGAVDAWRLRKALQHLGLDSGLADGDGSGSSLAVLSLSHDRRALALGPQLAVFAASLGIPTALVIGPQQDTNATAILRAACAAPPVPSRRLRNLLIAVSDRDDTGRPPDAVLTVVVAVVDAKIPQFAGMMRTRATILGVTAGAATAEQLARVAASAAADGRPLIGILVADPDPADHTTGRLPQLARRGPRRIARHITGTTTETWQ